MKHIDWPTFAEFWRGALVFGLVVFLIGIDQSQRPRYRTQWRRRR